MGGFDNESSTEITYKRRKDAEWNRRFYKGCYEEYLAHPNAQYLMTFREFKKDWGKKKRKEMRNGRSMDRKK